MNSSTLVDAEPIHHAPDAAAWFAILSIHLRFGFIGARRRRVGPRGPVGVEVGGAEGEVVLEEVHVPVHVAITSFCSVSAVALEQVGVRGVVVDDHLVDLREAVLVALAQSCSYSMPKRQCG
jgi:hypothetical protein